MGGLFEVGNPSSLAETVNNLLGNPDIIPELVANGRKRVAEEYTYHLNAEKYAIFYSE